MKITTIAITGLTLATIFLSSCKPTKYISTFGPNNQTQVILTESNFNYLGTFTGMVSEKANKANIKEQQGLLALARQDFFSKVKAAGISMTGSKTLINTNVDVVKNFKRITVSFTADIIEFK